MKSVSFPWNLLESNLGLKQASKVTKASVKSTESKLQLPKSNSESLTNLGLLEAKKVVKYRVLLKANS